MVVAQFAKRLPPTLEVRGSNPPIGKVLLNLFTVFTRRKLRKRAREWLI